MVVVPMRCLATLNADEMVHTSLKEYAVFVTIIKALSVL